MLLVNCIVHGDAASASEIPAAYRQIALSNRIPAEIFYAIALAESGRNLGANQARRPWPWTLNIHGKGMFFSDRHSAWRTIVAALAKQQSSVDIGLMQVNWRYHHERLGDPWQALDPYHNLRVGADILRECFTSERDWWASVGCYHAPANPARAERYLRRVLSRWQRVVNAG